MKSGIGKEMIAARVMFIVGAALIMLLAGPAAMAKQEKAQESSASGADKIAAWSIRCNAEDGNPARECEAYQRLVVAKSGQRVAEFAVGFPRNKKDGRGVIVLPLGILLNDGIEMQIDNGQKFKFKPRYCTPEGCFAFVNIDQTLLEMLKKGKVTEFTARAMNGKDVKIRMTLKGLSKALKIAAES